MRGCPMIDKRLLVDSLTITKATGETDGWGKAIMADPIPLAPVRFDRAYQVTGTQNNRSKSKPGVVFVYPAFCPVELDDSFLNAVVSDGQRDYRVSAIVPVYHPFTGKLFSYELEVV